MSTTGRLDRWATLIAALTGLVCGILGVGLAWQANTVAAKSNRVSAQANELARLSADVQTLGAESRIVTWPSHEDLSLQLLRGCNESSSSGSRFGYVGVTSIEKTIYNRGPRSVTLIEASLGGRFTISPYRAGERVTLPVVLNPEDKVTIRFVASRKALYANSAQVRPAMEADQAAREHADFRLFFDNGSELVQDWFPWISINPMEPSFTPTCASVMDAMTRNELQSF